MNEMSKNGDDGMGTVKRNRNILIAIDSSENAARAVAYVSDLIGGIPGFKITLLTLIAEPSEDYFAAGDERVRWLNEQKEAGGQVLESLRLSLMAAGFREEDVTAEVIVKECSSLAECILEEQEKRGCGTVVIGRRGISKKEEFLFGSTSNKILHSSKECSVWVVE
jgi:nucleotide-binding universal stress UspA family protein